MMTSKKSLSEITLRSLQAALASNRASLIRNLAHGHTNEHVNAVDHVHSGVLSPDKHQVAKAKLEAARKLLNDELVRVESALDRVRSGEHGQCVGCGHLIEHARLRDDPAASRCMNCACAQAK